MSRKISSALLACSLILIGLRGGTAHAQGVQDFRITDFSATYDLSNDNQQGLLEVQELISVDFSGQNRGILRALPQEYQGESLELDIKDVQRDGSAEPYITYTENDNTVVRIGNADVTITGEHTYVVSYTIENIIRFYDDYDELYLDINGTQWLQPFDNVSALVRTVASRVNDTERCFVGRFGSTETSGCDVSVLSSGIQANTSRVLEVGETLTIVQRYEKGYFAPPTWLEQNREVIALVIFAVAGTGIIAWAHSKWRRFGKDNDRGIVAPYFGRPKDIGVLEAAYVANNRLDPKYISAAIIDLAIRGYIKIVESGEGNKIEHSLELINADQSRLSAAEKDVMDQLFSTYETGQVVELANMKHKFSSLVSKLGSHIDQLATDHGYYDASPKKAYKPLVPAFIATLLFGLIGIMLTGYFEYGWFMVVVGVVIVATIIYATLMPKRSAKGELLKEHLQGLKLYLSMAEKDRIEQQDAVAAPLARNARQPKRNVKFFESLLPFAVIYGVEKTWAKAFADSYQSPPEWVSGISLVGAATIANSVSDTVKVTSQTFTAPANSGSSGSSGGLSGGGAGGGGGGGW